MTDTTPAPAKFPALAEFPTALRLALPEEAPADVDYDPAALAEWILLYIDEGRREAYAEASAAADATIAPVAEFATASGVISIAPAFALYLSGLAAVLKQNLGIAEQWDLARTVEAEAGRVREIIVGILTQFPELGDGSLDRPEVAGAAGLALPGQ